MKIVKHLSVLAGAAMAVATLGTGAMASSLGSGSVTVTSTGAIYGGFEDNSGTNADYDYNDLVFTMTVASGSSLTLNTGGQWNTPLTTGQLNSSGKGSQFFNNQSQDSTPPGGVAYCMYNTGTNAGCPESPNGHTGAINSSANFLTGSSNLQQTANDVSFTITGGGAVTLTFDAGITAATDGIEWATVTGGNVGTVHSCISVNANAPASPTSCTITAGTTNFILLGVSSNIGASQAYFSNTGTGNGGGVTQLLDTYNLDGANTNGTSHFAFFTTGVPSTTPEPGSLFLLGTGLLGLGGLARRRFIN